MKLRKKNKQYLNLHILLKKIIKNCKSCDYILYYSKHCNVCKTGIMKNKFLEFLKKKANKF